MGVSANPDEAAKPAQDFWGWLSGETEAKRKTAGMEAQNQANRPNIDSPFGSQNWERGPDGSWHMSNTLNPQLQGSLGNLMGQWQQNTANPLEGGAEARKRAEDAIYGQETSRLDPQWAQRQQQMTSDLANQGFDPGSEASRLSQGQFDTGRNDAYQTALRESIMGGGAEAERQQRMNLTARNTPLQEMLAMQGFGQMPGGFGQAGNTYAEPDSGNAQGLMSLIAAFAKLSDERMKRNIRRMKYDLFPGVPAASWEYVFERPGIRHVGVIAQDMEKIAPQYVITAPNGLKYVDYSFLGRR